MRKKEMFFGCFLFLYILSTQYNKLIIQIIHIVHYFLLFTNSRIYSVVQEAITEQQLGVSYCTGHFLCFRYLLWFALNCCLSDCANQHPYLTTHSHYFIIFSHSLYLHSISNLTSSLTQTHSLFITCMFNLWKCIL